MRRIKIKERIEAARNAFLEVAASDENKVSARSKASIFLPNEDFLNFTGEYKVWVTILKQIFLFFPGTVLVWFSTLALFFNYFVWQPQNHSVIFVLISGSLLMIGGIGDLKNPKHSIVPLSAILIGAFVFVISLFAGGQSFLINKAIYCFPLALIVPFLAKGFTDRKREN